MAFLNDTGLQSLITKVQSGIIQTQNYENITSNLGEDSYIHLLKIKTKNSTAPWVVKYRITVELTTDGNSKQIADVTLGGYGNNLSYYESKNIIYDTVRCAVKHNSIATSVLNNADTYIGIKLGSNHNKTFKISVALQGIYGCEIVFLNPPVKNILNTSQYVVNTIVFNKNGIIESSAENLVTREELATVAFSGKYEDLLNKPNLLSISEDSEEENLIFFTN